MGIVDDLKNIFNMGESQRRSQLGVGISDWSDSQPWYLRNLLALSSEQPLPDTLYGTGRVTRRNPQALLRRVKEFLAMRSVDDLSPELRDWIDQRYPWNKERPAENLLDYFTSVKYSYSSLLPFAHRTGNVDLGYCTLPFHLA